MLIYCKTHVKSFKLSLDMLHDFIADLHFNVQVIFDERIFDFTF